jgi:hypothetical protein
MCGVCEDVCVCIHYFVHACMHACICVFACMCACVRVCEHSCVHACMRVWMNACLHNINIITHISGSIRTEFNIELGDTNGKDAMLCLNTIPLDIDVTSDDLTDLIIC